MKVSDQRRHGGFEVKVVYTVGELARMLGWTRFRVARLMRRRGVNMITFGERSAALVPLIAFREAFPDLWASIAVKYALSARACEVRCPVCAASVVVAAT